MDHNKLVQLTFKMPYILCTNFIEVFLVIPEMRKCQSTDSINWLVVVREKEFVYCQWELDLWIYIYICGPGYLSQYSDSLMSGRSGDRITVGAIFSAPVQTGPGPTQPPIQWVPGLSRGLSGRDVALTSHHI